jgi:hypothetical protein
LRGIGAALVALELEAVIFALYGTSHWYLPVLVAVATAVAFLAGTVRVARRARPHAEQRVAVERRAA